jgi:hypothetical protein
MSRCEDMQCADFRCADFSRYTSIKIASLHLCEKSLKLCVIRSNAKTRKATLSTCFAKH